MTPSFQKITRLAAISSGFLWIAWHLYYIFFGIN
jgi:hypothetical protein